MRHDSDTLNTLNNDHHRGKRALVKTFCYVFYGLPSICCGLANRPGLDIRDYGGS